MRELRRSIFITFLSTNTATMMQFVVTIILSRLLSPADIGIFSITVVFVNMIGVFRDFGVSSYLQQEKNLTKDKAMSAFGLLLTSSWSLAFLVYIGRSYISNYYGEPGISSVLSVLCISYAIVPFASYFYAVLGRNLQAGKQAFVNILSTIVYSLTCLSLAYSGLNYMAMAWANVANIAITIVIYTVISPSDFPLRPSFVGWGRPARFGSGAIAGNLLVNINNSIPDLVLGKASGAHDVGIYSRANGLVGIFQQIAGPTIGYNAIPFIARNHHSNLPLAPVMARATSYLTGVAWPAFIFIALFAKEIILLLYGPQWLGAAPIVALIAIQSIVRFGYSLAQPALMAIGRPYLSAFTAGASITARLGIVLAVGAADLWTFALALCIADIVTIGVPAYLMSRTLGYTFGASARAHWPSIKVGLVILFVVGTLKVLLPSAFPTALTLVLVGLVTAATWVVAVIAVDHPLSSELISISEKFPSIKHNSPNFPL